jgi:hypothetical protein
LEDRSLIFFSFSLTGLAERLAGKPGAHDIDWFYFGPVESGQIAQVRNAGDPAGEKPGTIFVDLRVPRQLGSENDRDCSVQSAVAGAETS